MMDFCERLLFCLCILVCVFRSDVQYLQKLGNSPFKRVSLHIYEKGRVL